MNNHAHRPVPVLQGDESDQTVARHEFTASNYMSVSVGFALRLTGSSTGRYAQHARTQALS